ncbi:MAG: tail fiber domain-containing protein [Nonlabens sp.]|uniref:tail fiber domain-containing protein n=1 Tax=Nonlabens sp. TaxID=1888209 RepID=UPI003EF2D034
MEINKYILVLVSLMFLSIEAQIGIGTDTPEISAALDLSSNDKGLLIPRMSETDKNNITNLQTGKLIYQTTVPVGFYYYDGSNWILLDAVGGWQTSGNTGTTTSSDKIGTRNNNELVISTNSNERIRVTTDQKVGIGTNTPATVLHLSGTSPLLRIQDGNEAAGKYLVSDADGLASWVTLGNNSGGDNDWIFYGTGNTANDDVYHSGLVTVGNLHNPGGNRIFNGSAAQLDVINYDTNWVGNYHNQGTDVGLGTNEYCIDDPSEFFMSHHVAPLVTNTWNFGSSSNYWRAIFSQNYSVSTSDMRLKNNLNRFTYGVQKLMKLRPVSYQLRKTTVGNTIIPAADRTTHLGFIAQELAQEVPEVVVSQYWKPVTPHQYLLENSPTLGVRYAQLLPIIVQAIKEHDTSIKLTLQEQQDIISQF